MDEITISLTKVEAASLLCVIDESRNGFYEHLKDFKSRLEDSILRHYGQYKHTEP